MRRRALFLDRRFRKAAFEEKYPDGSGLLSRWVRVEKIPNLRECGVTDAQMDAVRSALLPVE